MSQRRQKKQLTTLDNVNSLTDQELREALKGYNQSPGPITDSTRSIYQKKLASLMEESDGETSLTETPEESDDETSLQFDPPEESDGDSSELLDPPLDNDDGKRGFPYRYLVAFMILTTLFFIYYVYGGRSSPPLKNLTRQLISLLLVSPVFIVIYKTIGFFKKRRDIETQRVCELVKEALELLQSPDNPKGQMPILHIRDTLLTPAERKDSHMINLWTKSVKFIEEHESRVKVELVNIDGEDFRAWKWIGSRKV